MYEQIKFELVFEILQRNLKDLAKIFTHIHDHLTILLVII